MPRHMTVLELLGAVGRHTGDHVDCVVMVISASIVGEYIAVFALHAPTGGLVRNSFAVFYKFAFLRATQPVLRFAEPTLDQKFW